MSEKEDLAKQEAPPEYTSADTSTTGPTPQSDSDVQTAQTVTRMVHCTFEKNCLKLQSMSTMEVNHSL